MRRDCLVIAQVTLLKTKVYETQHLYYGEVIRRNQTFTDMVSGFVAAGALPWRACVYDTYWLSEAFAGHPVCVLRANMYQ